MLDGFRRLTASFRNARQRGAKFDLLDSAVADPRLGQGGLREPLRLVVLLQLDEREHLRAGGDGLLDCLGCFSGVAAEEGDHAQLAIRAVLPSRVAELSSQFANLLPVSERGQHVPLQVDVALGSQPLSLRRLSFATSGCARARSFLSGDR